jgi:hypothetical protein
LRGLQAVLRRQRVTLEHQIRHSMGRAYQLKSELYCLLEGNRPIDAAAFHLECGRLMEEQMEVLEELGTGRRVEG